MYIISHLLVQFQSLVMFTHFSVNVGIRRARKFVLHPCVITAEKKSCHVMLYLYQALFMSHLHRTSDFFDFLHASFQLATKQTHLCSHTTSAQASMIGGLSDLIYHRIIKYNLKEKPDINFSKNKTWVLIFQRIRCHQFF